MQRPSFSIYDASAGSGKTYTLVKEYLKIILTSKKNDAYRNILAITFTNKAVFEMKSRIVYQLTQFSKPEPEEKAQRLLQDLSIETGLSVSQIKTKSYEIIRHIIHNYAAFDILTIDKFTHKVIRAFAHDLNLPITFEVTLDTESLLNEAVDAVIAKAGEDKVLTQLLIDFTVEKTDDDKSWDISREILETGKLIFNENNREELEQLSEKDIATFLIIKERLKAAVGEIEQQNKTAARNALQLMETNGVDLKSFSAGHFPNHLQSIAQGKFNPLLKKYHSLEEVKINKTAADRLSIEALLPEVLSILESIYKNFERRDFYNAFLRNITPLSLLQTLSNQLARIKEEQNILSIAEFNALIHKEIHDQPAPFIYERLGERYRHFFIDEFQDTSEMQWQNLIPLIDNALSGQSDSGEKGTLMIVGDPKQSIYRWRGGKAEQFIALSKNENPKDKNENPFSNKEKLVTHLETNYRSYSEIIHFNNSFFKFLSQEFENQDYRRLYQEHSYQQTNNKVGGYVNLSFLPLSEIDFQSGEIDKSEIYGKATLEIIQNALHSGFSYSDIAILTRKRDQGIAVANILSQENIPMVSSETLLIENSSQVKFIISVLSYLKNNEDIESKANFLFYVAMYAKHATPIHDIIAQGIQAKQDIDLEVFLHKFDISIKFNDIRKKPLYEAVQAIVDAFLLRDKNQAYLQYFLDIILERDYHKQAGISDFLDYWRQNSSKYSIPSPEGIDAVRIMTIHKSKGLEFPVVIIPFADEDYDRKPKDKLWIEAEDTEFGLPKVLVDNTKAVASFSEKASMVYHCQKQEELLDSINVLYVALTRAEEQLYLISQTVSPKKDGTFPNSMASYFTRYLVEGNLYQEGKLVYEFGSPTKLSIKSKTRHQPNLIVGTSQSFDINSVKIAQKETLLWGTRQKQAIEFGNVIHEILSMIQYPDDVSMAVKKALQIGIIRSEQQEIVYQTIRDIVTHPDLTAFFSYKNKILNEQSILQIQGPTVKPDRMVLTPDNEILLLDYKTGKHQEKYRKQVDNYQQTIEQMEFKVIKKTLVYIGETLEIIHL
ncbi:UvrD-helicase domain-containing protein [Flavobacterium sp. CYK-4]|uniref:UvrD-helicase domain-containing protein n=1 Tax=Flavobacterium lotistagni TaxID=2709660 RepID=UPI0014084B3B|nr:UvrD-helicase domain-containing protein [Flavobacterium lotistagni]NHM06015.1 UvrD-helicase domain-containing protein [Flavobacterium lotistagni]